MLRVSCTVTPTLQLKTAKKKNFVPATKVRQQRALGDNGLGDGMELRRLHDALRGNGKWNAVAGGSPRRTCRRQLRGRAARNAATLRMKRSPDTWKDKAPEKNARKKKTYSSTKKTRT